MNQRELDPETAKKFAADFRQTEEVAMKLCNSKPATIKYRSGKLLGSIQHIAPFDQEIVLCACTGYYIGDNIIRAMEEITPNRLQLSIDASIDLEVPEMYLRLDGFILIHLSPEQEFITKLLTTGNVHELKMGPEPMTFVENFKMPVSEVRHKELQRTDESIYRSQCPICIKGTLLVRRDQGTLNISTEDACIMCGRRFRYVDIAEGYKHLQYKSDLPN